MTMKMAGNCPARGIAAALLVLAGQSAPAIAETKPTYDKRIEEAAIRMLIPKLGDMRGSLDLKSNEYLRPLANQRVIENEADGDPDSLPLSRDKGSFVYF